MIKCDQKNVRKLYVGIFPRHQQHKMASLQVGFYTFLHILSTYIVIIEQIISTLFQNFKLHKDS